MAIVLSEREPKWLRSCESDIVLYFAHLTLICTLRGTPNVSTIHIRHWKLSPHKVGLSCNSVEIEAKHLNSNTNSSITHLFTTMSETFISSIKVL